MSTYASEVRRAFYDQVWRRALVDDANHWCRLVELADGTAALIPAGHARSEQVAAWPALPTGGPGWVPTAAKIQTAFERTLSITGPALNLGHRGDSHARRMLLLAHRRADAGELRTWVCDLLLQVAVFGQVRFSCQVLVSRHAGTNPPGTRIARTARPTEETR